MQKCLPTPLPTHTCLNHLHLPTCLPAYLPTYVYLPNYLLTYRPADLRTYTYIHTNTHASKHACMHAYIHTIYTPFLHSFIRSFSHSSSQGEPSKLHLLVKTMSCSASCILAHVSFPADKTSPDAELFFVCFQIGGLVCLAYNPKGPST